MTDVLRMGDVVQLREDSESAVGTLFGYFARFNEPTEINNPVEGHFIERLGPNSFDRTLAEHGRNFQVLFNHGLDPAVGQRPLGVPSALRVDAGAGVYAEVPLDDTSYNRDLAASLRSGALKGQSFRARWVKSETGKRGASGLPEVTRTEVALKEFGPVTFPAYPTSSVGIRSGDLWLPGLAAVVTTRDLLETDIEELFPELRSGAVLSNENLQLIDQAMTHLQTVKDNHTAKKSPTYVEGRSEQPDEVTPEPVNEVVRDSTPDEPAPEPVEPDPALARRAEVQVELLRQRLALTSR